MSAILAQLADSLTRQFGPQVAEQTLPVAEAWLSGNTAVARAQLGPIEAALEAGALIQSGDFVYLERSHQQESGLAQDLLARATVTDLSVEQNEALQAIAAAQTHPLNPGQLSAIDLAVRSHFGLLLGGPGTGKSTVIRDLVQAYLSLIKPTGRVALSAPTGKAAARLAGLVPDVQPTTLARLEQQLRQQVWFDLVIVDEASMVDLASAERLLARLPQQTRLIWVGDPNQLDSVEPGSILGELARAKRLAPVRRALSETYRFDAATPLGQLAQGALAGQPGTLAQHWDEHGLSCSDLLAHSIAQHRARLGQGIEHQRPVLTQYQLLCATRIGPWGSEQCNARIHQQLVEEGLIAQQPGDGWIIMVTRNQPALGLANGDVGIIDQGDLVIGERRVPLHLVPFWEMAWAISVHKSQGSEYDEVGLMLGQHAGQQGRSRALVYTGITRAKQRVWIGGELGDLQAAVANVSTRASGLADLIEQA